MKKMLISICLLVFLSSILVGCIAGSGNKKPEGSKSTDTSFPEAEPSTNETEPSSAPGKTYAETSSETEKNRNPVYIATAPEWPSETEEPENAEYDPTRYVDLVIDNPQVFFSASTVEASGTPQALGPAFCFDGDPNTRWSSDQRDVDGCWICVDFAYPVKINGLFVNECKTWGKVFRMGGAVFQRDTAGMGDRVRGLQLRRQYLLWLWRGHRGNLPLPPDVL